MTRDTASIRVRFLRARVRIRPLRPGDAGRVAVLCSQLGYPSAAKDVKRRLEEAVDEGHRIQEAARKKVPKATRKGHSKAGYERHRIQDETRKASPESGRLPHYSSDQAVFVAESGGGQLMGWVQVCVRTILVADRHAEVEGLVVDESWRGKGVGHALMKRAEAWARQKGCKVVSLRSNIVREGARPFYEGIGYRVVKTQWAFRKIL